jgi:hypothetical protein
VRDEAREPPLHDHRIGDGGSSGTGFGANSAERFVEPLAPRVSHQAFRQAR